MIRDSHRTIAAQLQSARVAQSRWARAKLRDRLAVIKRVRHELVRGSRRLLESVTHPARTSTAETLAAELIPLADACRLLEHEAPRMLASKKASNRCRPFWLQGVSVVHHREPWGIVLVVGASNYPLFLTGVQALQALVAGNAVVIKPGVGAAAATAALAAAIQQAGCDPDLIQQLPEAVQSVSTAIEVGVDKVVLTGSSQAGHAVSRLAADSMIPTTMELSGCDAVFILDGANISQVSKCLNFGLQFNHSSTCIAPRRVFVPARFESELHHCLLRDIKGWSDGRAKDDNHVGDRADVGHRAFHLIEQALADGARTLDGRPAPEILRRGEPIVLRDVRPTSALVQADLFAPVLSLITVQSNEEALQFYKQCPYALGATVFGTSHQAKDFAQRVDAGCVVINDMIAPTADPRVAFGGRRGSGFGVTRGAAGLREMTQNKTVVHQRSRWQPHLESPSPHDADLLGGFFALTHAATWRQRLAGAWAAMQAGMAQRRWKKQQSEQQKLESISCQVTNESQSSVAA